MAGRPAASDREVDEVDATAEIGREVDGGIARCHHHKELRGEIDLLVADLDENATRNLALLLVEDRVEDRVVRFCTVSGGSSVEVGVVGK